MKIDLSQEFRNIQDIEFDNEIDKQEHILDKLLDAMSKIVPLSLSCCARIDFVGIAIEDMPQNDLESFLTAGLIIKLTETLRVQASTRLLASHIRQKAGF